MIHDLSQIGFRRVTYARDSSDLKGKQMLTLQWSETLVLGVPVMDATHHEFVDLLAGVVCSAPDHDLLDQWQTSWWSTPTSTFRVKTIG
jgi:hypothetical protein